MRYFRTSNASRQYRAGDLAVTFEPLENVGGNWSGLLAVEDDSAANKIVAAKHPQIAEITAEEYEGLKKKPPQPRPSLQDSRRPRQESTPQLRVAGDRPTASGKKPAPAPAPPAIELKSAKLEVPDELKEIAPTPKPKPKPKPPVKPTMKAKPKSAPKPKSHKK